MAGKLYILKIFEKKACAISKPGVRLPCLKIGRPIERFLSEPKRPGLYRPNQT
jgi:hypothetical protein